MSAHTPGPWDTSRDAVPTGHVQNTVYSVETGRRIATAFEEEANARLTCSHNFASLVEWCEDNFYGEPSGPDLSQAYGALAAAKGTELDS